MTDAVLYYPSDVHVRSRAGERPVVRALAMPFDRDSYPVRVAGRFAIERLNRDADVTFDDTTYSALGHTNYQILGRVGAGTMRVDRENSEGVVIEVDPPDNTFGNDFLVSVERGDFSGVSIRMLKPAWHMDRQADGSYIANIRSFGMLHAAFLNEPAYPDTYVESRSRIFQSEIERYEAEQRSLGLHQQLLDRQSAAQGEPQ